MRFLLNPQQPLTCPVTDLVMSAPAEYELGEAEAIIEQAKTRLAHIEANGMQVCRHENGALMGFVLTTLDLSPHVMGAHIDSIIGDGYYVNKEYYGTADAPKAIAHGFTEADLGTVFFVAEAADTGKMPGHRNDMPSSICANMRWGKERDDVFAAFAEDFKAAGEIRAVNYLSHALIYAHDLARQLYATTLGRIGVVDYIQQDYDVDNHLCPYGNVDDGRPEWGAERAEARSDYAAAVLVR